MSHAGLMWRVWLMIAALTAIPGCKPKKKKVEEKTTAPKEKRVNVEISVVTPRSMVIKRIFHGETMASETRRVTADAFGKLTGVTYKEYGFVTKGQRLATIDGRRIGNQRVIQAQASLAAAQDLLNRVRALKKKDLATAQQLVDASTRVKSAVAALQIAKLQLQYNVVRAPISGYIAQKHADSGSTVNAGTPIVTIANVDTIKIRFWVPEMDLVDVQEKTRVELEVLAFPKGHARRKIAGTVHHVGYIGNEKNRTFPVDVVVNNSDRSLRVGMLTKATITTRRYPNAVLVAQDVIVDRGERKLVFVAKQGKAHAREIVTGVSYQGRVVVSKGLELGDRVIVIGQRDLQDGDAVRVVNAPAEKTALSGRTAPKTSPLKVVPTRAELRPTTEPTRRLNGSGTAP